MSVEIFKKIMELNKSVGFESEPNFLFSCRRPLVLRSFILSIVYFSILLKAGEEKQSRWYFIVDCKCVVENPNRETVCCYKKKYLRSKSVHDKIRGKNHFKHLTLQKELNVHITDCSPACLQDTVGLTFSCSFKRDHRKQLFVSQEREHLNNRLAPSSISGQCFYTP